MTHKLLCPLRCWLLCSILAGCAVLPAPPSEPVRQDWGTLVVVPARYPPKSNIRSFAVGKGEGAAKGAVAGSAAGLAGAGVFAATGGPLAVVIAPYLAVIWATELGAAGAYGGSRVAISAQDVAAMEVHIQHNLAALQVPDTLARAIVDTAAQDTGRQLPLLVEAGPAAPEPSPNYRALAQQEADSVLEVVATEVGFSGGKQLHFYLVATMRVVRVRDNARLYEREFVYQSDEYEARLWGENEATLFQAELQRSYASLAESVVEQVFLLTPLQLESRARQSGEATLTDVLGGRDACGLAWVSPEHDYHPTISDTGHRNWNRFPIVASRQPTLAWEGFPRDRDRRRDSKADVSGIGNVSYDLRVWQVVADAPPALLYERRGLPAPSHTLEQPLLPGTRYFWSARARFDLAGRVHGTKWGYFRTPGYDAHGEVKPDPSPGVVLGVVTGTGAAPRDPCTLDFIPTSNYYRFQTP